jgi:aminopeptidase N
MGRTSGILPAHCPGFPAGGRIGKCGRNACSQPHSPAAAAALLLASATAAEAAAPTIGAPGAGDPYFPRQGNGGYTVDHYQLSITYNPTTQFLFGHTVIQARARQRLTRLDLDLRRNLHVRSVLVNGAAAQFAQPRAQVQELVITPTATLHRGQAFTVDVRYRGHPHRVVDPDGSSDGFILTGDGAFVASEPQGSPSWFPVNDTPRDKATYEVSIKIPERLTAVSNGRLVGTTTADGWKTWSWRLDWRVSSYLVTATIGRFEVRTGTTRSGIPYFNAVAPAEASTALPVLRRLPAILEYFSKKYGRYPFGQAGAIVDHAHFVGYALETATRPLFDRAPNVLTLAHELAHQWYGDDVTLRHWRDIWLNEGFAEFSSWLWDEHRGGMTAQQHLRRLLNEPASNTDVWLPPPGNPGSAANIFAGSVYDRGAGALQALRHKLGSRTFFRIMRGWLKAHAWGNARVGQFTAYAERVSGLDLSHFFYEWLYKNGRPSA